MRYAWLAYQENTHGEINQDIHTDSQGDHELVVISQHMPTIRAEAVRDGQFTLHRFGYTKVLEQPVIDAVLAYMTCSRAQAFCYVFAKKLLSCKLKMFFGNLNR
jgi:hypothetical protein